MNYKIVTDEGKLKEFINWLPDLKPNEQFYFTLLGRKKYLPNSFLTNDKCQLGRKTATKDRLFDKIKQLECELGSYKYKDQGIPQEALALYILPNPRDLTKAGLNTMKTICDKTISGEIYNPKSLALNAIQTSTTRKIYYDVDLDLTPGGKNTRREQVIDTLKANIGSIINRDALTVVNTNGGFHILVELEKITPEFKKSWYKTLSTLNLYNLFEVMMNGDGLLPVPGTYQGGFTPHFVDINY